MYSDRKQGLTDPVSSLTDLKRLYNKGLGKQTPSSGDICPTTWGVRETVCWPPESQGSPFYNQVFEDSATE